MKFIIAALVAVFTLLSLTSCEQAPEQQAENSDQRILVFSKTGGWQHDSIEDGQRAMSALGEAHNIAVTTSQDADLFTDENLANYDAVVFLNTSENIFNDDQRAAFKSFIQNGGGFLGIHSASDTEYEWEWYHGLVGAYFDNHPNNPNVFEAAINVVDPDHPSTAHLPERWVRTDEWYNFQELPEGVNVVLEMDTDSYEGSDHPGNHPIAWYHEYDGGRAFYTGLGHTSESFSEDLYLQHLLGALEYVMGE